ncbi:unnamed protein product [Paramecium pentaurelia]|uniref:Palmitoyltransferase n=1 Tax=Paramecium pentaurelia TaxID=43138 RepID=A0A8S1SH34_9CILI|nr:unnamed protein product [Paramecium pentaurelia]
MIGSFISLFLLGFAHYQIVYTQPGPITITETPVELMQQKNLELNFIKVNKEQLNKKCQKCNNKWKPPKTHHCQTCKKCIHFRDHHCFWFNCCVGYKNLKYFCQFLMYFSIVLIMQGISCLIWFFNQLQQLHNYGLINLQWSSVYTLISIEVIFKLFQLFMIYAGYQLIYQLLKDKLLQLPDLTTYNEQRGNKYVYYADFKWKLIRLLGKNILYWILPIPNKFNLNYLELTYPKVTAGEELFDYYLGHLDKQDKDYDFYKNFEIK